MAELKVEVRTYQVNYMCDACGKEPMEFTGRVLTMNPPKYKHICPDCGDMKDFKDRYPLLRTVPIISGE